MPPGPGVSQVIRGYPLTTPTVGPCGSWYMSLCLFLILQFLQLVSCSFRLRRFSGDSAKRHRSRDSASLDTNRPRLGYL